RWGLWLNLLKLSVSPSPAATCPDMCPQSGILPASTHNSHTHDTHLGAYATPGRLLTGLPTPPEESEKPRNTGCTWCERERIPNWDSQGNSHSEHYSGDASPSLGETGTDMPGLGR
ncbi:hypothetical protein E2I00_002833, partial [Balaenoptera physalus]